LHQTVALRESSPGVGTLRRGDSVEDIDLPLVRRARRGERGAFEALTERYDRRLRALAFRMLGDPDLMDDALQEVAIKAFVSLRGFRGEAASGTMRTLSGRLVLSSAATDHVTYSYRFATTIRGDLSVRRTDGKETLAYDSRSRTALHVLDLGSDAVVAENTKGLAAGPPDEGPPQWILQRHVGAVVRALAAADAPSVREATLGSRKVWLLSAAVQPNRLALPDASGDHLEVAVDQASGFPLRIVETRGSVVVEELRIEQLEVDQPLAQRLFKPLVPAGATLSVVDAGFRAVPQLGWVCAAVGYRPLAPLRVPEGFTLGAVTVAETGRPTGKEGMNPPRGKVVSVAFRRGFDRLVVSTRLIGPDRSRWTDPVAAGEGYIDKVEKVKLMAGALKGRTASVVIDLRGTPHVWVLGSRLVVTVAGDATRAELLAAAESLAPYSE